MRLTQKIFGFGETEEIPIKGRDSSDNAMEEDEGWSEDNDWDQSSSGYGSGGVSMMPSSNPIYSGDQEEDYSARDYRNPSHVNMQKEMIVEVLHSAIMRQREDKTDPNNPVIRNLEIGERLQFLESGNNGRIKVRTLYDGKEGWVTSTHHGSGVQILGVDETEIVRRDTQIRNTRITTMFGGLGDVFSGGGEGTSSDRRKTVATGRLSDISNKNKID